MKTPGIHAGALWSAALATLLGLLLPVEGLSRGYGIEQSGSFVTLADASSNLVLRLNLDRRCVLDQVIVRGRQVVAPAVGVWTGIQVSNHWFTTRSLAAAPKTKVQRNSVIVSEIRYGEASRPVVETWTFTVLADAVEWRIDRDDSLGGTLEDTALPGWCFDSRTTWKGGLLDNGGVAWNRYLETTNASYGAHAGEVTFWNETAGDALRVTASREDRPRLAMRFSQDAAGTYSAVFSCAESELVPKHGLHRFHAARQDVWAPAVVNPGRTRLTYTLRALDYAQAYNRGNFSGLNGRSIRELLNTIGRYGVIDRNLVGANGWRTGYICLHEQWFAQMGIALMDEDYAANCAASLDFERDHAVLPGGRVKGRWAYGPHDAMAGTYDSHGYYEAQWGYLLDSQPCFALCVAELFDLNGDRVWLARQKPNCERVLDYLLSRDTDGDGLVEMKTDSHLAQRGSDWIDIIWAAHENALVNAELYYALRLWADLEHLLGDFLQEQRYREFSARLKARFNQSTAEGGFWDPTNRWYVYWRDKDGSVHGNNLVTPVNFAAIAYGICDDPARISAVLARIEREMRQENLFFWPLNFFPYQPAEGHANNFPFPRYENGDIFLSWGELAVRAYCRFDPRLALKYIKNVLAKYEVDGLSFQRYQRKSQAGAGDDILAGNCMPIVGLYRDVYGIQPKHNRLYLEPHLTPELGGTELRYRLRGQEYRIEYSVPWTSVSVENFQFRSQEPFGVNAAGDVAEFFAGSRATPALKISRPRPAPLAVLIEAWPEQPAKPRRWREASHGAELIVAHQVGGLRARAGYRLVGAEPRPRILRADDVGQVGFKLRLSPGRELQLVLEPYSP